MTAKDSSGSARIYYYDKDLKMYLPVGTREVNISHVQLDFEAETPRDTGDQKFIRIKGTNHYISAHEVAVETA